MQKRSTAALLQVIIVFVILNVFFIAGKTVLEKWDADQTVLITGNLVLFAATLVSYWLGRRGLRSNNPQAFVRSVYASFIVKFFILVIAAFVYIMMAKKNVNRPALFACMFLYIVYTFLEVSALMRLNRKKENA